MPQDMVHVRRPRENMFREEPDVRIRRSQFDRSHALKTTFDASYLYPIYVDEVLPGDTFTCRLNGFCRVFSPLDAPIMDNIELETFFFFVPTRLVWDNWAAFNGEHDAAGAQDTDFTIPIMGSGITVSHDNAIYTNAGLAAHFGLPHNLQTGSVDINSLPFRCYNLIYNEWFRDQNVIDELTVETGNGPDTIGNYALRKSAKKHDYFTSALPYLQKGDAVTLPLTGELDVTSPGSQADPVGIYSLGAAAHRRLDSDGAHVDISSTGAIDHMYVDLSDAAGISINALRESVAIQRLLERDARGGTRYVELIKAHFGVTSPDFRLQRPEFLGGGKSYINVSAVANTSETATENQGELRGVGTGTVQGHGWAKSFTEHGYVIGLIRARGDITYFQGIERLWARSTRYDFYIPALAHLGEQSILKQEVFNSNNRTVNAETFGYQERWAEYRFKKSNICGNLNPRSTSALSFWHLAEDFAATQTITQTFVEDQTPMSRVTTVDTAPDFLLDLWFNLKCARPIPIHSIPSLIGDRF